MKKIELPTVLAYEKSMIPTIALFYGVKEDGLFSRFNTPYLTGNIISKNIKKEPVYAYEYTMKTTRSDIGALKEKEKNMGDANIQRVEKAMLPEGTDALYLNFSVIFNDSWKTPYSSNSKDYFKLSQEFAQKYIDKYSLRDLAILYARQIFSNEWCFRNARVATKYLIGVSENNETYITFEETVDLIENALSGQGSICLHVEAFLKMTELQEVYPTQLFLEGKEKGKSLGKVLAKLKTGQVFFSDVKIGNALRTIDTWYEENASKIAIQAFGVDPTFAYANRKENGNHLYYYLQNLNDILEDFNNEKPIYTKNDLDFIVACFILGGLYNGESKKEKIK